MKIILIRHAKIKKLYFCKDYKIGKCGLHQVRYQKWKEETNQQLSKNACCAVVVLDAFGQLPRIVTQKNDKDLGAFDQCMETFHKQNATEIKGKYCLYGLKLALSSTAELLPIGENAKNHTNGSVKKNETTSTNEVYLAICIPDACLPSDLFGQFGQDTWCQTKDSSKKFDKADIICV